MPDLAEERDLRERLATIGVKPAPTFEGHDVATRAAGSMASPPETQPSRSLYRDPAETVPSTMRWFSFAWHYFSSARERSTLAMTNGS